MNKVFEKIIEKLEEQKSGLTEWAEDEAFKLATDKAIAIVKQEAEQFGRDTNVGSNGWIPCSERLPSDCAIHEVTAQFRNGKTYTEFAYYDETKEEWWKHDDDGLVNVIAWKEPSDPYQPKGE